MWLAAMQIHCKKESVNIKKRFQLPQTWFGLVWFDVNMAAISLFWNSNMAATTSYESAHVFHEIVLTITQKHKRKHKQAQE